ncbi:MAG: hypothetical protein DWB47_12560 [Gammaproteobacteria bacterium]|nr:hypothetical protein [Gammaproteobacteria bacterium]
MTWPAPISTTMMAFSPPSALSACRAFQPMVPSHIICARYRPSSIGPFMCSASSRSKTLRNRVL